VLSRLPKVFSNFVADQYMAVFAITLPYTNPFKYNHYTVSLAHRVIAIWFLKCRTSFRRNFVEFIHKVLQTTNLTFINYIYIKKDYYYSYSGCILGPKTKCIGAIRRSHDA